MVASLDHRMRRGVEPLLAIACVAALLALGVFASMVAIEPRDVSKIGLVASTLAAIALCVVLVLKLKAASPAAKVATFEAMFGASASRFALTDEDGAVLAANGALRRAASERIGRAAEALAPFSDDARALEYRLLQGLASGAVAEEVVVRRGAARRIRVERLGEGRLLWFVGEAFAPPDQAAPIPKGDAANSPASAIDVAESDAPPKALTEAAEKAGIEDLPVAVMEVERDGRIIRINELAASLVGEGAAPGALVSSFIEGLGRAIGARIEDAFDGKDGGRTDLVRSFVSDTFLQIAFRKTDGGETLIAVISDATELKTLEQQFVQSQKMQAVGQLAGGVAHDFNNLLTAIMGHCDLLSMRRDQTDPDFEDLSQIRQNANRAAAMVRQLLAFSRQQMLKPKVCQLNDVLNELTMLLNRLIGERIRLEMKCDAELWNVWIDEQQFEQVILNLVVNARDALPEGGAIRVECLNEAVEKELRRDRAIVPPGDYVIIRVVDDGRGMTEEVRAKVFEPFFTTKPLGEGTGLGLSTAYGIIKQTGGFIFIDSAPGEGATFTIYLPRLTSWSRDVEDEEEESAADLTGAGRVLLVEDEAPVRNFALRALEMRGYDVVGVSTGEEALELYEAGDARFDVVISDIVMPGLDGPEWVRRALEHAPDMKVIFTSGYDEATFRRGIEGIDTKGFLAKPFSLVEILSAVKKALDQEEDAKPAEVAAEAE